MNRVTRTQFVSTIAKLPFHTQAVRDESGTVNYYKPGDKEHRDLIAVRKVSRGNVLYYLTAALSEGI